MSNPAVQLGPAQTVECCSPLSSQPLSLEQAVRVAPMLKALADPVRLRLVSIVASHAGGEACVCDLTHEFDLSQPTISHHLKLLHDSGLVDRDRRGVWVYYRVRTGVLASLGALIGSASWEPADRPLDDRPGRSSHSRSGS
jgi:ArsR family transcriptional regulator